MSKIICFDTETTGFGKDPKKRDELLQITIVDENCNVIFESYIRPVERKAWVGAYAVNHISPDMVKDAPTVQEIAPKIKKIFDEAEKVIGYNVQFDVDFVERCCDFVIDPVKVIDVYRKFTEECKKKHVILPRHKLGDAIDYYCPDAKEEYLKNAHDASCDAIATMKVYNAQVQDIPRFYKTTTNLSNELKELIATKLTKIEEQEAEKEIEQDER